MPLPKHEKIYTYADYLKFPENERWEIVDGLAYLQAAPSWQHQAISLELTRQFANYLKDKPCRVFAAPFDVMLADGDEIEEDIKTIVQPDVVVICDESKLKGTGYKGVPALIIEITSPSTIRSDKLWKFNKYEQAGVKEYWIVEPEGKMVSVFKLQETGRYGRPEIYTDEESVSVSVLPDLEIELNKLFV